VIATVNIRIIAVTANPFPFTKCDRVFMVVFSPTQHLVLRPLDCVIISFSVAAEFTTPADLLQNNTRIAMMQSPPNMTTEAVT
jgi:hypothetical protein